MTHRVEFLIYTVAQLNPARRVVRDAPAVDVELPGFRCRLRGPMLEVRPVGDFNTEDDARAILEPLLHGWEAKADIIDGYPLQFDFLTTQFEDIPRQHTDEHLASTAATIVGLQEMQVAIRQDRPTYPLPDPEIKEQGQLTALLRSRWQQVVLGRESVTAGAYFIATAIAEHLGSGDGIKAVKILNISSKLMQSLTQLTSIYDPEHGRKASKRVGSLTVDQLMWIRAACPAIIRRVMEYEAGADTSYRITKADLPPLPVPEAP